MKKLILCAALLAATAFGYYEVHCVYHDYAYCSPTGQYKFVGIHQFQKYHCTCGDDVWVREY